MLRSEYFEPLGLAPSEFAAEVGMDAARLAAMLAGEQSIDVDAAVRISRALQIPAERIMQLQLRFDFAAARSEPTLVSVGVLAPPARDDFPDQSVSGRLRRATDTSGDGSLFFQQDVAEGAGDDYAGLHALWRGDWLRIYAQDGAVVFVGPVLHGLDGRVQLPFVRPEIWETWFEAGARADLAIGADHAAFFERMHGAG